MDEAVGLEKWKNSWSIQLHESQWGLKYDQKDTTHPISLEVIHTEQAIDIFDAISYGKGAQWLKQVYRLFGREAFREGIKLYFQKFAMQNTFLDDFIDCMHEVTKTNDRMIDFKKWSESWLKTAGCCTIWHTIEEIDGKISNFCVH